jgi:hypothetical protein
MDRNDYPGYFPERRNTTAVLFDAMSGLEYLATPPASIKRLKKRHCR